ncbi:predicted protein [Histoplasma capsulatum G186AR]|uniref:Uncharacterized protein n=1 Tax=Ajellomyces capsulatus (strain G186AR / H82 / ATCC MYA-2454 / RMSCC 2432) TaxID=447093 RepID=C0NTC7_AJECG|nr:uncharacterized protein HCBG_06407 [Histoplasma capsulatum G186AR]EEH05288.1 predicted protein [Histoplasma capsulatum G186AR]
MNAGRRTQPDLQSPRIDRIINPEVYPTRDERVHLAAVGARRKRPVSSVVPNSQSQDSTGDVIQGQGEGCLDVVGWYLNCNATNVDPGNILEGTWSLLVPRCQPRVAPIRIDPDARQSHLIRSQIMATAVTPTLERSSLGPLETHNGLGKR